MKIRRRFIKYCFVVLGLLVINAAVSAPLLAETKAIERSQPTRTIMYTIRPLALIGQEVVGDYAEHHVLLPPGITPHDYVLKISDISRLQQADIIIWMGPEVEPYLSKIISKLSTDEKQTIIINVSDADQVPGIELLAIKGRSEKNAVDGHHEHESLTILSVSYDPHIWLSPLNAELIAGVITERMGLLDPNSKKEIEVNFELFKNKIDFKNFEKVNISYKPYVVYHDAFIYLENYLQVKNSGAITDHQHSKAGLRHIVNMADEINVENISCMVSPLNFDKRLVKKVFGGNDFDLAQLDLMADVLVEGTLYTEYLASIIQDLKVCINYKILKPGI